MSGSTTPSDREMRRAGRGPAGLGDFTLDPSVWRVFVLAAPVGALAAGLALGLLDLIGFVTHVAYYGRAGFGLVTPATNRLGALSVAVPVIGGILIGAMAYWGS